MKRAEAVREWPRVEEALAAAVAEHRDCFFALFPIGSYAMCRRGDSAYTVRIIKHHDYLERVVVESVLTRKRYWIDGPRLVIPTEAAQ